MAEDSVNLYTFTLEKEGKTGFAIVSGDERVADVYVYVEEGSLSDTICIKGMANYIRKIPELCAYDLHYCGANEALTKCSPPDYYTNEGFSVRPLISTQWHQHEPYNWGTPGDVCDYYYAGCGVIAMAQIVAYYQKCDRNFDFAALTKYTHIDVSSDSYLTHEVSEFVKYVGSLCNSEYSCSASPGTITYFPACMRAFTRLGYEYEYKGIVDYIDYTKLDNCISKGNVILAFGLDEVSRAGHFWVIDGYVPLLTKCDAAKIHCNWGWGGKSDGWYTDYTFRDNYTRPWYSSYHLAYEQRFAYLNVKK